MGRIKIKTDFLARRLRWLVPMVRIGGDGDEESERGGGKQLCRAARARASRMMGSIPSNKRRRGRRREGGCLVAPLSRLRFFMSLPSRFRVPPSRARPLPSFRFDSASVRRSYRCKEAIIWESPSSREGVEGARTLSLSPSLAAPMRCQIAGVSQD